MSSPGNSTIDQVAQVAQALQNSSLQSPSQVLAAANAVPLSTGSPNRVMSSPFQKGRWPKDWYEADFHTELHIEEKTLCHLLKRGDDLKEKGAKFASFAVMGDHGNILVRAQQFPGLGNLDADRTRVRILVERRFDGKVQMKSIDLQDLPAHESDG
ncbi:hypothetical protein IL306_012619 [Fusarium sp. DS 682]|nr:hypothetical protein IL306_012619 [Fusarium sp. DS 682]